MNTLTVKGLREAIAELPDNAEVFCMARHVDTAPTKCEIEMHARSVDGTTVTDNLFHTFELT